MYDDNVDNDDYDDDGGNLFDGGDYDHNCNGDVDGGNNYDDGDYGYDDGD